MLLSIYTVHDKAVSAFLPPFTAKTDGEAIRMFQDICADSNHQFHRHAHDYHLYRVGTYDDNTAYLKNSDPPEMLISAVNAIGPPGPVEAATQPSNNAQGTLISDEVRRLHERGGEATL